MMSGGDRTSSGRKAVLQCTSDLTSLLKHNLSCSGKLLEKGLITESVHDWILTAPAVSNQEKAARLVSCLADRVKSIQLFHELIKALKETDPFCGDIVDKLTDAFQRESLTESEATSTGDEKKQVGATIDNLEKQFSSLQRRLSSELTAKSEVSPEILLESLTLLPIALRNEYQKFILENLSTLENADSIRKIFFHLNPLFSFIDYHLIKYLVEEFASMRLKRDMSVYVEAVQVFLDETTVLDLMDHWPGRRDIPPHFEELRAVIDGDPSKYTLRQLDDLRKRFCSETRLSEVVLSLIGVGRKNSFVVRWVVPSIFVPQLKSVISSLRSFYQREHIFSVTVGRQRLYSIAAEYEERLLLLCSTGTGEIHEFEYLLSQPGLDTNIYDKTGISLLWNTSFDGRTDIIQLLLDHRADVDFPNDNKWGETALMGACIKGQVTTAALLIEKGANVNYITKFGHHPLYKASFFGSINVVKLLLDHGAQIDLPSNDDLGGNALIVACENGHVHVASLLIERGAAIDYQNKRGASPLYVASQNGHDDVVRLLLDNGAKVDLPAKITSFKTPVVGGQSDVTQDHDSNMKKFIHFTPLMKACDNGRTHTASLLIEAGADINHQDEDGWTPLMFSSTYAGKDIVELLIEKKADLDVQTKEGWTALSLASWKGRTNAVEILVQAGADVNIQGQVGLTALMLATQKGHANIVQTLLDGKAGPNITDKTSGWTAIFFAIEQNNLEIIEMLIRGGAKLDTKDNSGLTAFEVAKAHDQQAVCNLLEMHGSKTTEKEITQEQKEHVKASSQRLRKVLDFLERTLLREKAKKKEQQQPDRGGTSSNIFQRRREKQLAKKMKEMTIHTDTTTKLVS